MNTEALGDQPQTTGNPPQAAGNSPDNNHTFSKSIEDKDIYKTAVDTRNFEINLFWQRSNYFLVLNSALAVGFFNSKSGDQVLSIVLAFFGAAASLLWFRVTLGSKYWQSRWEKRLSIIEDHIAKDAKLFSADRATVESDVKESFSWWNHGDKAAAGIFSFKKYIENKIINNHKSHSVSFNMILLSLLFTGGWMFLALWGCYKLLLPFYT